LHDLFQDAGPGLNHIENAILIDLSLRQTPICLDASQGGSGGFGVFVQGRDQVLACHENDAGKAGDAGRIALQ